MPHNEGLAVYESWDLAPPVYSPPSRLYSLEPIGIGTPYGESLTSYIARLAQAHHVTAAVLFDLEIMRFVDGERLRTKALRNCRSVLCGHFRDLVRAANGMGMTAAELTRVVEALTLRGDISFLTMKPWAAVFAERHLLRLTHAACFHCYEEWRVQGNVVYDPLLWSLEPVCVCPRHLQPLSLQCRFCGKHLRPLATHSYPGHCSNCGEWLGTFETDMRRSQLQLTAEWKQAIWIANAAGELIAAAPDMAIRPAKDAVARAISNQARRFAGKLARLARFLQANRGTMGHWRRGKTVPELGRLLRICFCLETSPLQFLRDHSVLSKGPTIPAETEKSKIRSKGPNPPGPLNIEECRNAFRMALEDYPPPTLKEVARRLSRSPSLLLRRFPEQYEILVARHAQYQKAIVRERWEGIRPAVQAALTEEPPPLPEALAKRIGCSISSLKKYYPRFYRVLCVRHANYRKSLVLNLRSRLEAVLRSNDPPTSFATLAGHCGCTKATLRRHFPDLVPLLIQKVVDCRRQIRLTQWQQVETEMRQVALQLHKSGLYPSIRRVAGCLTSSRTVVGNAYAINLMRAIREEIASEVNSVRCNLPSPPNLQQLAGHERKTLDPR